MPIALNVEIVSSSRQNSPVFEPSIKRPFAESIKSSLDTSHAGLRQSLRYVFSTHSYFIIIFETVNDDVVVLLEMMSFARLELFFRKRLDSVIGGYLEPIPDGPAVGEQIVSLGIACVTNRTN